MTAGDAAGRGFIRDVLPLILAAGGVVSAVWAMAFVAVDKGADLASRVSLLEARQADARTRLERLEAQTQALFLQNARRENWEKMLDELNKQQREMERRLEEHDKAVRPPLGRKSAVPDKWSPDRS